MFDPIYQFLQKLGYPHPIHPTEVHLPIGAVIIALILGYCALLFKRPRLFLSARHCIVIALISLFPTILLGVMDWQHFYMGAWLYPIKIKGVLAGVLLILLSLAVLFAYRFGAESKIVLSLYTLSFFTVVGLGYYGGNLVYGSRTPAAPTNLGNGRQIFDTKCSGCHPQGGNSIVPDLPLITAPQLTDYDTFLSYIRDPKMPSGSKGIMPAFSPTMVTDDQARDLYLYIYNVLAKHR